MIFSHIAIKFPIKQFKTNVTGAFLSNSSEYLFYN